MVAQERMKVADLEAELRECTSEREALKLAMKILEEENQRFRNILASASQVVRTARATTPAQLHVSSPSRSHSRRSSQSSSLSIPIVPSAPDSPYANPQSLTHVESLPSVVNITYPRNTTTTVDPWTGKEPVQPQPVTRLPPPLLELDGWADSPDGTPHYTSAPPETAEPDQGEGTARLAAE